MHRKILIFGKEISNFITENMMLIAIMVCVTISILSRAYFDLSYISPDSAQYLLAAREILRGNGFHVYPDWFAIWPIGYPALIAIVAFITRAEIYLASKILSIIIVWIIGLMLYKHFGRTAWAYAFVMLNVGFRYIFFYTWSETVFLLAMVLLTFWVADIVACDNVKASHYVKLTLAVLLLFLSRYIGAFALSVIGLLWLGNSYSAIRHKCKIAGRRVIYLTISGIVSGVFILSYLLMNQKMTGYMTGIERVPAGPMRELLLDLYRAMMIEMDYVFDTFFAIGPARLALLLWFGLIGFFIYAISKSKKGIIARDKNIITPLCFIVIGIIYWVAIIIMRLASHFDDFDFRLLFSGSAMLFIGFIGLLTQNEKVKSFLIHFSGKAIPVICLSGFLLMMLVITPRLQGTAGYRQVKDTTLSTYAAIPDGAMVLWGDTVHLLFMRDNLGASFVNPEHDMASFWDEYQDYEEVYIFVPEMKEWLVVDFDVNSEIYAFFGQYVDSDEEFVRIK